MYGVNLEGTMVFLVKRIILGLNTPTTLTVTEYPIHRMAKNISVLHITKLQLLKVMTPMTIFGL